MRIIKLLHVLVFFSIFSFHCGAVEIDDGHRQIYYGDVNGDGVTDIYFHGLEYFVLIHGDVTVPLVLRPNSFVIYQHMISVLGEEEYFYDLSPTQIAPLDQSLIDNFSPLERGVDYYSGDFNGDENQDFLVLGQPGPNAFGENLPIIVGGTSTGEELPAILALVADSYTQWGTDPRIENTVVADINGDGKDDLVFESNDSFVADTVFLTGSNFLPSQKFFNTSPETIQPNLVDITKGQFRVGESGAANYTIPIAMPAGTAGVSPKVSLAYSSQAGNGIVGLGWNLSVASSVSRCRQTLAHEMAPKPISWSNQDRFCLDGQRLLLVSGTYGEPNSVYKTEIDLFAEIKAVGGISGNPSYFVVEKKDGSISYYGDFGGDIAGATQTLSNQYHLNWSISESKDSAENKILYNYDESPSGHRLSEIYYGFDAGGITHNSAIRFTYEDRLDGIHSFVAGESINSTKRLSRIDVENQNQPVRTYRLNYKKLKPDLYSRLSRLASVQECVGNDCLPAMNFTWSEESFGFSALTNISSVPLQSDQGLIDSDFGDINGDGCIDAVFGIRDYDDDGGHDDRMLYALSDCSGFIVTDFANGSGYLPFDGEGIQTKMIDYNVDGRSDVIVYHPTFGNWRVYLSTPVANGEWKISSNYIDLPISDTEAVFGDFNSDGLVDVIRIAAPNIAGALDLKIRYLEVDLSQPISSPHYYHFGPEYSVDLQGNFVLNLVSTVGDLNGDGLTDLKLTVPDNSGDSCFEIDGCYFPTIDRLFTFNYDRSIDLYSGYNIQSEVKGEPFADINNDGYIDVLLSNSVKLNHGDGTFSNPIQAPIAANEINVIDYNGDGYGDLINKDGHVAIWNPLTQAFLPSLSISIESPLAAESVFWADANGDGKTDRIRFDGTSIKTNLGLSDDAHPLSPLVVSWDNGFGNKTYIKYETLSQTEHYQRINIEDTAVSQTYYWGNQPYSYSTNQPDVDSFYSALNGNWDLPIGTQSFSRDKPVLEFIGPVYVVTKAESSSPSAGATPGNVNYSALSSVSYFYGESKVQAAGRGTLGFHSLRTVDNQTGVITTTTYRQDYPFIGYPLSTEVKTASGNLISRSTEVWELFGWQNNWPSIAKAQGTSALGSLQPYKKKSVNTSYKNQTDLNSIDKVAVGTSILATKTIELTVDAYGNSKQMIVSTVGGGATHISTTTNDYGNLSNEFEQRTARLSQVQSTAVFTDANGVTVTSPTRTAQFTYYNVSGGARCNGDIKLTGLLCEEIIEPAKPTLKSVTYNQYDLVGNKINVLHEGNGIISRHARSEFDPTNRFLQRTYNALDQVTNEVIARNSLNLPTQVNGANGFVSYMDYDVLGRKTYAYDNTGAWQRTKNFRCGQEISCPIGAVQRIEVTGAGGSKNITYLDMLGRIIRAGSVNIKGLMVFIDSEYDGLNRLKRISEPFYEGDSPTQWTHTNYDILGRTIEITLSDGAKTKTKYNGYSTVITNPLNQELREYRNLLGDLIEVLDSDGSAINYAYDALGDLTSVKTFSSLVSGSQSGQGGGAAGNNFVEVKITYDDLGRKKTISDPDKGNWTYEYNVIGELTKQTDGKGQSVEHEYDKLGRMITRTDRRADNSIESFTSWHFDGFDDEGNIIPNSMGQITAIVQSQSLTDTNCASASTQYCTRYSYDNLGRNLSTRVSFGSDGVDGVYTTRNTIDNIGRVTHEYDVLDGVLQTNSATQNSGIQHVYNNYGYVELIQDIRSGDEIHRLLDTNARGQVTKERLANGVTTIYSYDSNRGKLINQRAEIASFFPIQNISYSWDVIDNLKSRHNQSVNYLSGQQKDLRESFCYDQMNRVIKTISNTLNGNCAVLTTAQQDTQYDIFGNISFKLGLGAYDYSNSRPHAVSHTADGTDYLYDNNGNLSGDSTGRFLTYSTFDKPLTITKSGHTTSFKYGPDRTRLQKTDTDISGVITTTTYLGSIERITKSSSPNAIEWKRYLNGVAIYTVTTDSNVQFQSLDKSVVYTDHLGSTDVITDMAGNVTQSMSFDLWGQRRDQVDWSSLTTNEIINFDTDITNKGFTGHEMLDEVGIINMGGRIYDAKLGRFLQADPYIEAISDSQMFNRYSYVRNNPLNTSDPSGYFSTTKALNKLYENRLRLNGMWATHKWLSDKPELSSAIQTVAGQFGWWGKLGSALFGAHQAFYATGDVTQTVRPFVTSIVIAAVSEGVSDYGGADWNNFEHAVAQGVVGGVASSAQGGEFGHGFISSFAGSLAPDDFFIRTIVGGVVSEATGGKFKNGAMTAIYSQVVAGAAFYALENGVLLKATLNEETKDLELTIVSDWTKVQILKLFVNGQLNNESTAALNGSEQLDNPNSFYVLHNPTHGLLSDTIESGLGKLLGPSRISKDLKSLLMDQAASLKMVAAHSQGAIIVNNALKQAVGGNLNETTFYFFGPAQSENATRLSVKNAGGVYGKWYSHDNDFVGNIIGGGAWDSNQGMATRSILDSYKLFMGREVSPHSSYKFNEAFQ